MLASVKQQQPYFGETAATVYIRLSTQTEDGEVD